ncbi:MAG: hypothetical protein QGH20_08495 [Candidatus Latescibacteria bacterium]|nr:hypothetical protein [Candidatus Latescibacterota bacterium]
MSEIIKLGTVQKHLVEVSPFLYDGRLLMFESVRPRTPDNTHGGDHYLRIRELGGGTGDVGSAEEFADGKLLTEFGDGMTFGVPFVWDDTVYVYATLADKPEVDDIFLFWSNDMSMWQQRVVVAGQDERLFNCSVCRAGDRFVMSYESNDKTWPAFTIKFAESDDLMSWRKISTDEAIYGTDRYTACPSLRFLDGYFYMWYLEKRGGHLSQGDDDWFFETFLTRSQDLLDWQQSPANPILTPAPSEDINNSDIDFCEFEESMIIYYSWGSQRGEENLAHASYDGTLISWILASYA